MKKTMIALFMMPFLMATTCESDDNNIDCTLEAVPGLNVVVKDAETNEFLLLNTTVIAQDGDYTETLEGFSMFEEVVFLGAWERMGTYVITVSKEGYQTFVSEEIQVTRDECHVIRQNITVNLEPND
jgi:hypothetical protein